MDTNAKLPPSFLSWYWDTYADGNESPSYVKFNDYSEYGCTIYEYAGIRNDWMPELEQYLIRNKYDIPQLLSKWISAKESELEDCKQQYEDWKRKQTDPPTT